MGRFTSFLLLTGLFGAVGCITQKDGGNADTQQEVTDTQTETGGDTQDVWSDTGCDEPEGDMGQSYEQGDPRVTFSAGPITFSAVDGKYFYTDCATSIDATEPQGNATSRQLLITLEGSLDFAGSYNVLELRVLEAVGQCGNNFEYKADDLSSVTFDVAGFGPNGAVHGALSGPVAITDAAEGTEEMTSLVLEAWPKF